VLEAHDRPGGAAHSFCLRGHEWDAGPSFFAGLSSSPAGGGSPLSSNPLAQVLSAIGEAVPCVGYDRWITHVGDGGGGGSGGSGSGSGGGGGGGGPLSSGSSSSSSSSPFPVIADGAAFAAMVRAQGGPAAAEQWARLERLMAPLAEGVGALPAAALRADPGVLATALRAAPSPLSLLRAGLAAPKLTAPFARLIEEAGVTDPWLKAWLDLECFVLSGMTAGETIAAEMVFMFCERHKSQQAATSASPLLPKIEYPLGGSAALVAALVRGLEKHGGRLVTRATVAGISVGGAGRADGVRVVAAGPTKGSGSSSPTTLTVRARRGVISNASAWDTARLLPGDAPGATALAAEAAATPPLRSFMHLFVGIDASGLPPGGAEHGHHLFVRDLRAGAPLTAPQNVAIVAVPSAFDPSLAPPGCATLHAYTAANEPWEDWAGLERGSPAYESLKEERVAVLWSALERAVAPDVRARARVSLVGTPLTHARFLRRHRGSYGPAISAASGTFPGPATPVPGLWRCGDSCAPGVGVPAAAASGMILANTVAGLGAQWGLLRGLGL
jgi:phytoene dehydrogenase-like protein